MADLITSARALLALPSDITAGQTTDLVPTLITAASALVERYCNRTFTAVDYIEDRSPSQGRQYSGKADSIVLSQLPVNSVSRVATSRTTAITITNTSTTNQRATVQLTYSGSVDTQLTPTGITLTRVASGTTSTSTLAWASYTTVSALATAINALGNGWSATATTAYASWPTTELTGSEGPTGARSTTGTTLDVFAEDVTGYTLDRASGVIYLPSLVTQFAADPVFGATELDGSWGMWRRQYRIAYNAGYATIPDAVQQATVLTVQSMFANSTADPRYTQVSQGDVGYTLADAMGQGLPIAAQQILGPYRVYRS